MPETLVNQIHWIDDSDKRSFTEKAESALAYYADKYPGQVPTAIYVAPRDKWWAPTSVNDIPVVPRKGVYPKTMLLAQIAEQGVSDGAA